MGCKLSYIVCLILIKYFSPSYRDYFLKFDLFVIIVYFLLSNLNKINLFDLIGSMIQVTEFFFFKCLQHLNIIFFVKKIIIQLHGKT